MIQWMLAILSLVPLPFLNPDCTCGSSQSNASLEDFQHNLASMWNEYNCVVVWTFFGIALLWDWNENWPFQSCGCLCFHYIRAHSKFPSIEHNFCSPKCLINFIFQYHIYSYLVHGSYSINICNWTSGFRLIQILACVCAC